MQISFKVLDQNLDIYPKNKPVTNPPKTKMHTLPVKSKFFKTIFLPCE